MTLNQRHGRIVRENCNKRISNVCLYCGFYCRTAYWSSTRIPPPAYAWVPPRHVCAADRRFLLTTSIRFTYRAYWVPPRLSDQQ